MAAWPFTALGRDAHPQTTTEPITEWMRAAWALFTRETPLAALALVLVLGVVLAVALRRRDLGAVEGDSPLRARLAGLAPLLLVGLLVATALVSGLRERAPAGEPLRVQVVGRQWWWEFRYPGEDVVTATELHVPRGRAVTLELESRDVQHSFWVPAVGPRQDVPAGEERRFTFTPERTGVYPGQCAEWCGASHAHMRMSLHVHEAGEWAAWVAAQQAPPVLADSTGGDPRWEGQQIFVTHSCRGCHTVRGLTEGPIGPDLTHFASRGSIAGGMYERTDDNLARWLRHANELKPGSTMPGLPIPEHQMRPLVAWLQGLR